MGSFDTLTELGQYIDAHSRYNMTEGMSKAELAEFERACTGYAAILAEFATYAFHRGGSGYSDHGHEEARKKAEAQAKRIRKVLGYSYP